MKVEETRKGAICVTYKDMVFVPIDDLSFDEANDVLRSGMALVSRKRWHEIEKMAWINAGLYTEADKDGHGNDDWPEKGATQ